MCTDRDFYSKVRSYDPVNVQVIIISNSSFNYYYYFIMLLLLVVAMAV